MPESVFVDGATITLFVDKFADVVNQYGVNAAIKLQFRQLDSFIHKDFIDSDLKYVKRYKETK